MDGVPVEVVAVVAVAALILLAAIIGLLLADRTAQRDAWRRIADERGRVREHRHDEP